MSLNNAELHRLSVPFQMSVSTLRHYIFEFSDPKSTKRNFNNGNGSVAGRTLLLFLFLLSFSVCYVRTCRKSGTRGALSRLLVLKNSRAAVAHINIFVQRQKSSVTVCAARAKVRREREPQGYAAAGRLVICSLPPNYHSLLMKMTKTLATSRKQQILNR